METEYFCSHFQEWHEIQHKNFYNNTPEVKAVNCKLFVLYITSSTNYVNFNKVDLFIQEYTPTLSTYTKAGDYQVTLIYLFELCRD